MQIMYVIFSSTWCVTSRTKILAPPGAGLYFLFWRMDSRAPHSYRGARRCLAVNCGKLFTALPIPGRQSVRAKKHQPPPIHSSQKKAACGPLATVVGFVLLPSLPGMRRGSHGRGAAAGS